MGHEGIIKQNSERGHIKIPSGVKVTRTGIKIRVACEWQWPDQHTSPHMSIGISFFWGLMKFDQLGLQPAIVPIPSDQMLEVCSDIVMPTWVSDC